MDAKTIVENVIDGYKKHLYAMYLRKSRADLELEALGEGETLARHKAMLYSLAERHNIYPDQIVVYHEVVSGDSIDDRPEMQRLLADVYARKYKGVLVVEVERLARGNTKDQGEVADAFQFSSTHIITPAKVYDPNDEFDQEYFEFGLFMSRREYKTIKRRLSAGKALSVQEGNYLPSSTPFGYTAVRKSKKERILVENPEESKYVRMIFDWYTEDNKATSWIAKQMTLMKVPTRRGGEDWSRITIRDMLSNIHYIGKVSWGRTQTIREMDPESGKVVKKKVKTGKKEIYEGKHKGIISEEQFRKAQEISGTQAPLKLKYELSNPLSGILVCARCGRAMRYQTHRNNGRVNRYHHHSGVHACAVKSLPVKDVLESLVEALKGYISDFQVKLDKGNPTEEADRHKAVVEAMRRELAKQEKKKMRLFDSWEADDGTYTKDEFLERKQMYTSTIAELKKQIEEAEKNKPEEIDYEEKIVNLHSVIDCIRNEDMDPKARNQFLKKYIERIEYDAIDFGKGKGGKAVLDITLK